MQDEFNKLLNECKKELINLGPNLKAEIMSHYKSRWDELEVLAMSAMAQVTALQGTVSMLIVVVALCVLMNIVTLILIARL